MRWVVNATSRPLYPPGKTQYPLYRRLGEPQGRSGRVQKVSPQPGFNLRTVRPVASRYTDWAIPAHGQTPIPTEQMAGWVPEPGWTFVEEKNLLPLQRIEPRIVQPIALFAVKFHVRQSVPMLRALTASAANPNRPSVTYYHLRRPQRNDPPLPSCYVQFPPYVRQLSETVYVFVSSQAITYF
jgi:hypothetical protein